jgi:hypothetical protein
MSLSPPRNPTIGQIWVDPFTAERFIFTGEIGKRPDEAFDGWERWELRNEQYEYEQGETQ